MQQLEGLQMRVNNNLAGRFGGNHSTKTLGQSCDFADYRDYAPGDDMKKIDWNAFARFDRLYLKLYLDERQMHTRIYLDASKSMKYGGGKKEIQAIRLAAAVAYLSVCDMDKVSVYTVKENRMEEVISGLLGKERFFDEIVKLNEIVFDGDSFFSEAIMPSAVGYGDGMSVVISDFLTENDYEGAIDHLTIKRRDVTCMQVLSREELHPTVRGKVHFFDSENSARTYRRNVNKEIIKAYKQALAYATDRIRNFCASRGANYLLVPADKSLYEVFFGELTDKGVIK